MIISGQTFDEERALYGQDGIVANNCLPTEKARSKKEGILRFQSLSSICVTLSGMMIILQLKTAR